jgi:hypothetical protein
MFVSKILAMLESDSAFEKSLLNKAKKQQDLVVMSYDSDGTTKVLYEPILGGLDCNVAVAILNDNVASVIAEVFF